MMLLEPSHFNLLSIIFPCFFAFLAGFIDSIAGGGGLIQLPALLVWMPTAPLALLFGTNKLSSIAGTGVAVWRYSKHVKMVWSVAIPCALVAFVFSALGARTVSVLPSTFLRPVILMMLILVAIYTYFNKKFGSLESTSKVSKHVVLAALVVGVIIGFYDGFFGPGTGSFLTFIFIGIFGMSFLPATAITKIINFSTNLAAVLYFAWHGNIIYYVAVPMAFCNMAGSLLGTKIAIKKGSAFVRLFFLGVVLCMICKIAYDTFQ